MLYLRVNFNYYHRNIPCQLAQQAAANNLIQIGHWINYWANNPHLILILLLFSVNLILYNVSTWSVIFSISTNSTFTLKISYISNQFQLLSFNYGQRIKSQLFIKNITQPPRSPLHLVNVNNTCSIRVTAAAGTNLAGTFLLITVVSLYSLKIQSLRNNFISPPFVLYGSSPDHTFYALSRILYCSH